MPNKERFLRLLRRSERYTKTDMVYLFASGWWSNWGTLIISACSLGLYTLFAHVLPKDVYGEYQYLLSVAAIIGAFALTGMNSAVARAVAQGYEGDLRRAVRIQLWWGVIPALLAFGGGGYYLFMGNATLGFGLLIIGLISPVTNALNTYSAFLHGKKDFRRGFLYSMAINIPYYAAMAAAAALWKGALVLLAANLATNAVMLAIVYRQTLKAYKPGDASSPDTLRYGMHLSAMGWIGTVVAQIDNILVFQYLGAAPLAVYSFATAMPDRAASFLKFIPAAALPRFAEQESKSIERRPLMLKVARLAFAILAAAGAYMLLAPLFFSVFFPQYADSVPYSQAYALSMVAVAGSVIISAFVGRQETKNLYLFNIIFPLVQLGLMWAGIAAWGLWGLVGARVASSFASLAISAALFARRN